MSESGSVGFLERDQSAGELEQGKVVLGFLRSADQKRAIAVELGVTGLDDPATSAPFRSGSFELELVAAATDVGGVAALGREVVDPRIGIAAVEAEALRMLG